MSQTRSGTGTNETAWQRMPGVLLLLLAFAVWVPLAFHVMAGQSSSTQQRLILLPAIPATLVLYGAVLRALRHSTLAKAGASLVFFWLLIAVLAPFLPLADPNRPIAPFAAPGTWAQDHFFLLGADLKGRDMLSRTIWGCQRVLVWGTSATAVAYVLGTCAGLAAGYWRGLTDSVLSFLANTALSFPVMVLFILVLNILGPGGFNIIIAVTFATAPAIMRIVRALTIGLRERDYVKAAQMRGERAAYIMLAELLPNMRGTLLADLSLRLGYTIVAITALTFLGLGLQPPDPDWGLMIAEAARVAVLWKYSHMLLIPAFAVSSLVLGCNLIADGMAEAKGDTAQAARQVLS